MLDLDGKEIEANNERLHPVMTRPIGEYG